MVAPPPKMEPDEAGAVVVGAPPKVNPELAVVAVAEPNTELVVVVVVVVEPPKTDPEVCADAPKTDPEAVPAPPPKTDPPDCDVAVLAGAPPNTEPLALGVEDADPGFNRVNIIEISESSKSYDQFADGRMSF